MVFMTRRELFEQIAGRLIEEGFVREEDYNDYESCRDDIAFVIEQECQAFTFFLGEPLL